LRHAVIEDDGEVAYLYLTEPGRQNVVASALIYSRINFPDPTAYDWTFLWSNEGESVAVLADGRPLACIVGAVGPGYSRGLEAASSLGHAWDDTTFARVFRRV
jgi:hypothetical protein